MYVVSRIWVVRVEHNWCLTCFTYAYVHICMYVLCRAVVAGDECTDVHTRNCIYMDRFTDICMHTLFVCGYVRLAFETKGYTVIWCLHVIVRKIIHGHVYIDACQGICIYVYICIHTYIYINMCMLMHVKVCMYVCMYVCVYIYICIHTYIYIDMFILMHVKVYIYI
jgi:hypothetical protein